MFQSWVRKLEIELARAHNKLSVSEALAVKKNEQERDEISKLIQQSAQKSKADPLVREREKLFEEKKREAIVAKCNFEEAAAYFDFLM